MSQCFIWYYCSQPYVTLYHFCTNKQKGNKMITKTKQITLVHTNVPSLVLQYTIVEQPKKPQKNEMK